MGIPATPASSVTTHLGIDIMKGHALHSLAGALLFAACTGDPTGPSLVQFVVRPEWLTPEVQPFLDADGQFAFPDDWQTREGDMPLARAMAVAVAWAREGEHSATRDGLRLARGTEITFRDLVPCAVPRLLRTPLSRIAHDDTLQGIRNALGSQWPVALCSPQSVPMVVVFVAAQSAITVADDGSLLFPPNVPGVVGGSDVSAIIAVSAKAANRLSPGAGPPTFFSAETTSFFSVEEAVARTFEATGRRIATLPRQVGSIFILNPLNCGRWEMVLESPVTVLLDGSAVETDTLFVPGIHCFEDFGFSLASPDRIGEALMGAPVVVGGVSREVRMTVELPIVFHPVTIPPS